MTVETTVDWDVIYEFRRATKWKAEQEALAAERQRQWELVRERWELRMGMMAQTEDVAVSAWVELLAPWFEFEHEVEGRHHTGRKVRIDALLHPRFEWRGGGRLPIGFEIKRPNANQSKLIGQAVDYANSRWVSERYPDYLDVFVAVYAPEYSNDSCPRYHGVEQLLGRLGVVMFDISPYRGLELRVSGNRAWNQKEGPCYMNWAAKRKFGSR